MVKKHSIRGSQSNIKKNQSIDKLKASPNISTLKGSHALTDSVDIRNKTEKKPPKVTGSVKS